MEMPDDVVADVRKRLRRAGGQVQAVERMLDEGRECQRGRDPDLGGDEGARASGVQADRSRLDVLRRATRRSP